MRCAICQTNIGKGRNPGGDVCGRCAYEARFPYQRGEWQLCAGNLVRHKYLECSFEIVKTGNGLVAKELHVAHPDRVLQDDFDGIQKIAVDAYLDLIGWTKLEGPKPN